MCAHVYCIISCTKTSRVGRPLPRWVRSLGRPQGNKSIFCCARGVEIARGTIYLFYFAPGSPHCYGVLFCPLDSVTRLHDSYRGKHTTRTSLLRFGQPNDKPKVHLTAALNLFIFHNSRINLTLTSKFHASLRSYCHIHS
ncbi:hypothetical protein BRADI_3g20106v3 [Brachypodium distachyon]|uniref:Uncharacterized protein n=1 Tax=Brachypodium distachyon TaxID=15368 RepID=A0A0Q3HR67_BRADI|nr:hypothetical protein BRADI_3g20106v3 [Brachypodium distachyon]KQJ95994.1 hypothetical protein BRADI_3g20106v3 [Brachypodium distachyon]PNT67065.1 hypothetical protein BRADI_3g20106v3 [Brachypodium distachyon]